LNRLDRSGFKKPLSISFLHPLKDFEGLNYLRSGCSFSNPPVRSENEQIAFFESPSIDPDSKSRYLSVLFKENLDFNENCVDLLYRLQVDEGLCSSQLTSLRHCAVRIVDRTWTGKAARSEGLCSISPARRVCGRRSSAKGRF
jgi:hypothetical protein